MNAFAKIYAVLTVLEARFAERQDEKGVTAIEYALMAAAIAGIVTAGTAVLSGKVSTLFSGISV